MREWKVGALSRRNTNGSPNSRQAKHAKTERELLPGTKKSGNTMRYFQSDDSLSESSCPQKSEIDGFGGHGDNGN